MYRETLRIIRNMEYKPNLVIWENVKGLLSKKNEKYYLDYLKQMEEMGYSNFTKVINAVDCGIPQKRERVFVISCLKKFNNPFLTNIRNSNEEMIPLNFFLEKKVDMYYYITQKSMAKAIVEGKIKLIDLESKIATTSTITTKQWRWNNAGVIKIPFSTFNQENYVSHFSNANSIQTITAKGANSRIKIAVPPSTVDNETIQSFQLPLFLISNELFLLRILTEKECWRLMGFKDNDFEKVSNIGISRTKLYQLAGNSIVVECIWRLFRELDIRNLKWVE